MTTTKATVIAITKHETHSYYVIILTFSPVILHCNSSFTFGVPSLKWPVYLYEVCNSSLSRRIVYQDPERTGTFSS